MNERRRKRTADWVREEPNLNPLAPEFQPQQPEQQIDNNNDGEVGSIGDNQQLQENNSSGEVGSFGIDQQLQDNNSKVSSFGPDGLVQALQTRKAELITFDGEPHQILDFHKSLQ